MLKKGLFIFSLLMTFLGPKGLTQEIILKKDQEIYNLGKQIKILEDPTSKLSVKDVAEEKWAAKFKKSTSKVPNFGFTEKAYWARFFLKEESKLNKRWILSFNFYLQDEMQCLTKTFFRVFLSMSFQKKNHPHT